MSIENAQASIIGEPSGDAVTIETNGRVLKPLLALPNALVDEFRLQVREDGLHIATVDPANVGMLVLDVHAAAFDHYAVDADEMFRIGMPLGNLRSALRDARMGKRTADDVALRLDASHSSVTIERDYGETAVKRTDEFLNIDPASVREEPDMPDLAFDWRAGVDVDALRDAVNHIASMHDHVRLSRSGDDMIAGGKVKDEDAVEASRATFKDVVEPVGDGGNDDAESLYSIDYLTDFVDALKKAKVDDVEVVWAGEYPIKLRFQRSDDETVLYEGRFMMAPRIQSGGASA